MPIFMCQALATMKSSMMIAMGSELKVCLACASRQTLARSSSASDRVGDDPDQHGERNAADQRAPGQGLALAGLEAVAEVPDEMAQAREQMMQQRPGVTEHDQAADEAAGEGLHMGVGGRPGS